MTARVGHAVGDGGGLPIGGELDRVRPEPDRDRLPDRVGRDRDRCGRTRIGPLLTLVTCRARAPVSPATITAAPQTGRSLPRVQTVIIRRPPALKA